MLDRFPRGVELLIFLLMALLCALIAGLLPKHDYAMMFLAMPVFFISALMGFRHSERRAARLREAQPTVPAEPAAAE